MSLLFCVFTDLSNLEDAKLIMIEGWLKAPSCLTPPPEFTVVCVILMMILLFPQDGK